MITLNQWKQGDYESYIKVANVAMPGEGKTYLAATFPKNVFMIMSAGEQDTFLYNPNLHKNIVGWEELYMTNGVKATDQIKRIKKFVAEEIRPGVEKKEIETVTIDTLTHLAEIWWDKISNEEQHLYKTKGGEFDTRSAYGALKDELKCFIRDEIISLKCNVILNVHLKLEDDETMAKKPDKTITYSPMVLGGFRDLLPSLVSHVFYLEKQKSGDSYRYIARTNKANGMAAKSRLNLPAKIEDVNYDKIKQLIDLAKGAK